MLLWDHFLYYNLPKIFLPNEAILLFILFEILTKICLFWFTGRRGFVVIACRQTRHLNCQNESPKFNLEYWASSKIFWVSIDYCIFYICIRKFNAFSSAKPSWFSEIHAFSPKNMHFSPKNMQFSPKNMQFFLKYMHFSIYVLKRLNRGRWYTFWIGWRHLAAIWDIKRT